MDRKDIEEIGKRIREIRGNDKQKVMAQKISYENQSMISKIENGKQAPSLDLLLLISKEYGASIDWILGRTKEKRTQGEIITYYQAVKLLIDMILHRSIEVNGDGFQIKDPILEKLLSDGLAIWDNKKNLNKLEWLEKWEQNELMQFDMRMLICTEFLNSDFKECAAEARNEEELLMAYKKGFDAEEKYRAEYCE